VFVALLLLCVVDLFVVVGLLKLLFFSYCCCCGVVIFFCALVIMWEPRHLHTQTLRKDIFPPEYNSTENVGCFDEGTFVSEVFVRYKNGELVKLGKGWGNQKKLAENDAALNAFKPDSPLFPTLVKVISYSLLLHLLIVLASILVHLFVLFL